MNEDRSQSTEDNTRRKRTIVELGQLVACIRVTEEELDFQLHRLSTMVKPSTEEEAEYFERMKAGYAEALRWIGILRRYHKGRLDRGADSHSGEESTTLIPQLANPSKLET